MTPDTINDWVTAIMKLSAAPFTVVAVIALGYFFRAIPKFNNEWLWIVCGLAGAFIFPVLGHCHADDTATVFFTRSIIMGLILGMGAWAIHDKILKQIEDKGYSQELLDRGVKRILYLGFAFEGKHVLIRSKFRD